MSTKNIGHETSRRRKRSAVALLLAAGVAALLATLLQAGPESVARVTTQARELRTASAATDFPWNRAVSSSDTLNSVADKASAVEGGAYEPLRGQLHCLEQKRYWRGINTQDLTQFPEDQQKAMADMRKTMESFCTGISDRDEADFQRQMRRLAETGDIDAKVYLLEQRLGRAARTAKNYLGPEARGEVAAPTAASVLKDVDSLREIANTGHTTSMRLLSDLLIEGSVVPRDPVSSFAYQYWANHSKTLAAEDFANEMETTVPAYIRAAVIAKIQKGIGAN